MPLANRGCDLQVWSMEVQEQGACSLWALAGQKTAQQKEIAEHISINQLIDCVLKSSDKLQYVGMLVTNY